MAQDWCGECTSAGALRVITADMDPNQIKNGYQAWGTPTSGTWDEREAGPFIVTNLVFTSVSTSNTNTSSDAQIAYAEPGQCNVSRTLLVAIDFSSSSDRVHPGTAIQNGRFLVPAGKVMCIAANKAAFAWSGFHPYE